MRRNLSRAHALSGALILTLAGLFPSVASAQSGSWNSTTSGVWSNSANWTGAVIADGANNTATFATAGLTSNLSVNLDTFRTLGALFFDNPTNNFGWSITGKTLTLSNTSTPTITVNKAAITATINNVLAGSQGLNVVGPGTLSLTAANTYSGGTTINSGTVVASPSALGSGAVTLAGGTLAVGPTHSLTGFGGGAGWVVNGNATFLSSNLLQLTANVGSQGGDAWFAPPIPVGGPFTLNFTLINGGAGPGTGGLTVGFQNAGVNALGATGGGFGYSGITPSAVLALNLNPANTQGGIGSGIGVLTNGASPTTIEPMPSTFPVNLAGTTTGLPATTQITMSYDGANMSVSMLQGTATYSSPALPLNIAGAVGSSGLFGFTAAANSQLQVSNFVYTSPNAFIPGVYANNLVVSSPSTIQVTTGTSAPTVTMGSLSLGSTLAVIPDPANTANTPYGLTFGNTTVTGTSAINVTNNGTGLTTLTLGNLSGAGSLTVTGGPAIVLAGGSLGGRLSIGTSNISLGGLDLEVGSLTGTGGTLSGDATSPINLTVGSDNTSFTYAGAIVNGTGGGPLALAKTGTGTLTLTGANTYSGTTTVLNGTLAISSDAQLGTGTVTINGLGTLQYTATTSTSRHFNPVSGTLEVSSGATLTLNGATVAGGYLDGPGTFNVTGGTVLAGLTTYASSPINVTGAGTFTNVNNGSPLTVSGGSANPATFNQFTNEGSGSVTIGASSIVNAAGFQSMGMFIINPATSSSNPITQLVNTGATPMNFGAGSETFIGTPATVGSPSSPNLVAGINLHGQNAVFSAALISNNGFVADSVGGGSIIIGAGSLYTGAGAVFVNVVTQNGGTLQAGNSPGPADFGSLIIGPGAINDFLWQINNATGAAGPTPDANNNLSGWSQLQARQLTNPLTHQVTTGNLTWTATPTNQFSLGLETLLNPEPVGTEDSPGPMANFDPTQPYVWPMFTFRGTYSGPTDSATLTADTLFFASGFQNPHAGTFTMVFDSANQSIDLVYSPVPEPGTLVLTAAGLGLGWVVRRRRNPRRHGAASRCTVPGENAGRHTEMYSAPAGVS